jgi:hypothetical protein
VGSALRRSNASSLVQRRDGNGSGDAVRLLAREKLRRVCAVEEMFVSVAWDLASRQRTSKHGEPHGRLQGATDLRGMVRRKPSESGGTARTERVRSLARCAPKNGRRSVREWTHHVMSAEGIFDEPHERSSAEGWLARASDRPDRANRYESSKEIRAAPFSCFRVNPYGRPCGVTGLHANHAGQGWERPTTYRNTGRLGQPRQDEADGNSRKAATRKGLRTQKDG